MTAENENLRDITQAEKKGENKLHVKFADGVESIVPLDELPISIEKINLDTIEIRSNNIVIQRHDGEEEKIAWDVARRFGDPEFAKEEEKEDMRTRNKLGRYLNHLREEAGLTQNQLAELAEISRGTISRIENGVNYPNSNTLKKIADSLGLSFNALLSPTTELDQQGIRDRSRNSDKSKESDSENQFEEINSPVYQSLEELTPTQPILKIWKKLEGDPDDHRNLDSNLMVNLARRQDVSSNKAKFSGGPHG